MSDSTIKELLGRASEIRKKYEMIAEITGERFNIFSILGLQTRETRTHSAFLRELLDPQGSHGLKDAFLKSFLRIIEESVREKWIGTDLTKKDKLVQEIISLPTLVDVVCELDLGSISEDYSKGGRIDLIIAPKASGLKLVIENKIYANDQKCQMVRYYNYDRKAVLLYLTLHGNEASASSLENLKTNKKLEAYSDYFPISYKIHILNWLHECQKIAVSFPLVRETLFQYSSLINSLTQNNSDSRMTQDIKEVILRDKETFLAYRAIVKENGSVQQEAYKFIARKFEQVADENAISLDIDNDPKNPIFYFTTPALKLVNLSICFGSENNCSSRFFGFVKTELDSALPSNDDVEKLRSQFKLEFDSYQESTAWWPVWQYWENYDDWNNDDVLASIQFDKCETEKEFKFVLDIRRKLKKLMAIASNAFGYSKGA